MRLYEEPDKPNNALDYLKNNFGGKDKLEAELKAAKEEISVLKEEVKRIYNRNISTGECI